MMLAVLLVASGKALVLLFRLLAAVFLQQNGMADEVQTLFSVGLAQASPTSVTVRLLP